ncbi:MAG TPA: BON domain-containing protein, partial [Isosphaeraceae bacterium]|nr:BON domain-containing protein [Isosphaeraceae bacterium]
MRYQFWAISSVLLCAALTSGTCAAQEQNPPSDSQKGTGQKVGEKIDEAIRDIKQGVDEVSESVRERFARARESVNTMGVESRVYGRLHWDKDLNKAKIDLEVRQGGVATL